MIYVLTVMGLIWLRVRDIEDKTASWSFRADRSKKKRVKSKRVMHQAFEYVGAMILTWSFSTVARISQWTTDNNGVAFPLLVLMTIFVPLQGALNYLIYFQPKWLKTRLAKRRKSKLAMMKAKELSKIAVVRAYTRKHPALNSASNPNPSLKPVAKDTQTMSTHDNSDRIEKIAKAMKRRQSENAQTLNAESEQDRRTSMPSLYVKIRSLTHKTKKESLTRFKKKMGHMNGKSVHFRTHTIDTDGYQFPLKQGDACVEEILPADFGLDNIDVGDDGNSDADPNYRPMKAQDEENIDSSFHSSADESSFGSQHGKEEFLPGHLMNDGTLGFQDTIEKQGSGQFFLPSPTAATSIVNTNFDKRSAEDLHPPSRLDRKDILTGNDSEDSGDHLDDDYMNF